MKRHHYACALGLFGLLMVVGARDTRAQVIEARVCFMVGQALYSYTVMHLGPEGVSPRPFVLGGYRRVSQGVLPLSGGGVDVFDAQGTMTGFIELHEAITGGGTANPAATTTIVITNIGTGPPIYFRSEYGAQLISTQGALTAVACP